MAGQTTTGFPTVGEQRRHVPICTLAVLASKHATSVEVQDGRIVDHGHAGRAPGEELCLLLDGVLDVEVDGAKVAEVGPGALVGQRALLEGGHRTATLRAVTDCRVAVADKDRLDLVALEGLAAGHRRED